MRIASVFKHLAVLLVYIACVPHDTVNAASLKGHVVDSAGRPVAGAEVRVFRKARSADEKRTHNEAVTFDGAEALRTDAEGNFETRDLFNQDTTLRVVAQADEMLAGRSAWITPADNDAIAVPNIMLRRLRTVTGCVVDRAGMPVADAKLFNAGDTHQRIETKTEPDGRFQLAGLAEGEAFLFIE
ncbi:MAG TPA: carboxypeptidase-like regulatory domain-containing protein [Pirellulales bacterium]|jgi:hypothetical protein|nr:carboxypeptidase-like regulatory domain-containing protein [Pirellulales bacterium]